MLNEHFIKQGIKEAEIEDFIKKIFPLGDYSKTELQRTPLGIKIIIYTNKPGRIIGKGGKNINEMTDAIKVKFGLENPQLDVKAIRNPNLDPKIVAKQIASALEKGYNYKKIGNLTIKRIMDAGAIGAQIIISGKLGGGKSMTGKFQEGHLKHCGQPAKDMVNYAFETALVKLGKIGIKVKIMREFMEVTGERLNKEQMRKIKDRIETAEEMMEREMKEKEEHLKKAREEKEKAGKRGPEKKGKEATSKRKGIGKPAEGKKTAKKEKADKKAAEKQPAKKAVVKKPAKKKEAKKAK
jgi:small subunit ribosomal protein S3